MKDNNKSKITVIVLFVLMLISIAPLLVFIFMAANNLEERQSGTSSAYPWTETEVSAYSTFSDL